MRAIFRKELLELALAALLALAAGIFVAFAVQDDREPAGSLMAVGCLGAIAIGVLQGVLDRRARADEFLLHRPVSWFGLHAARTAAALVWIVLFALVPPLITLALPYRQSPRLAMAGWFEPRPRPFDRDFSLDRALALVALALAFYAVVRLGAASRRPRVAACAMVFAPVVLLVTIARPASLATSFVLAAAVTTVALTLTHAALVRPAEVA